MTARTTTAVALLALLLGVPAAAQDGNGVPKARSLDELLDLVRRGRVTESRENARREAEFKAARDEQRRLLAQAKARRDAEEKRSNELETAFEEGEIQLAELEALLAERLGSLGELFGVVRQVAGDTAGQLGTSIVSAEHPGRTEFLDELAQRKKLPRIEELERLWFLLQQEMTESGKVTRFPAEVVTVDGRKEQRDVIRVGVFNAISDGKYLRYLPSTEELAELGRQPPGYQLAGVRRLEETSNGPVAFYLDPARGSLLGLLVQAPSWTERIEDGREIGYIIISLGAVGVLLVIWRLLYLTRVWLKVRAQRGSGNADQGNPLGRVLRAYEENREADVETLELKLEEAILKETPRLEGWLGSIKVLSVIAPLLGLLGTVTGMIIVFQQITLLGTGDPKDMAGGISQALVTTVLGLCVAIPLTLLHSIVSNVSRGVVNVLEEESAGIVATHAERESGGDG